MNILHFLPLLILLPGLAYAGAWTQAQGRGLFIAQATYFTGNKFFNADGDLDSQSRFSKYELQPYAEYGITDAVTVGGTAFLHRVQQSGDENYGLGDPEVFLRTRLWHDDTQVLTLQPLVKLPSTYSEHGTPRGGNTAFDGELSLLYGRNLQLVSNRDYLDTRIGYRARGHHLNPQYRADIALGLQLSDAWQLIPAVRGILAEEIEEEPFSESGDLDYDLVKTEVTAAYRLNAKRWVQATLFTHVAGRQTGAGHGISIGMAEDF